MLNISQLYGHAHVAVNKPTYVLYSVKVCIAQICTSTEILDDSLFIIIVQQYLVFM